MILQNEVLRQTARALQGKEISFQDGVVAAHLQSYIAWLDRELFGTESLICVFREGIDGNVMARWTKDRYEVAVADLCGKLLVDRETLVDVGLRRPVLLQQIQAIAVHEVRHRIQYTPDLAPPLWTPRSRASGELGDVLHFARRRYEGEQYDWEDDHVKREFDAIVVEYYALQRLMNGADPSSLVSFPFLWP